MTKAEKSIYIKNNTNKIIEMKSSGMTIKQIANELDIGATSVQRVLHNNGIRTRNTVHAMCARIILKKYKSGSTIEELSEEYQAHEKTIVSILRQNGEDIKTYNRYSVNENYFSNLDDQNKLYILGLIYSDGNIKNTSLNISLQERDMHILDAIRALMGSTNPLKFVYMKNKSETYQNQYKLSISNKKIVEDLKRYGVIENKSLKLDYPNFIPDELLPHFIRGIFDGDGHIEKNRYTIEIIGTKNLLFGIKEKLDKILNISISVTPVKNSEITYELRIRNMNDCIVFLDYIYSDAILYIRRKYDVYQRYLNESL